MEELPKIRVAVADDDALVLEALSILVSVRPGVELVARCHDGLEILEAVRTLRPDAVITDVGMPGGGASLIEALAQLDPPPLIVAISGQPASMIRHPLLAAGAHVVLQKGTDDPVAYIRRTLG